MSLDPHNKPLRVIFLLLAHWGKSEAFDRVWTLASLLLMGVFAILFSFNLWAG